MSGRRTIIYDTTLRDGMQGQGINYTLEDKVQIAVAMDEIGIDYIDFSERHPEPGAVALVHRERKSSKGAALRREAAIKALPRTEKLALVEESL